MIGFVEQTALKKVLQGLRDAVIVEAGAFDGAETETILRWLPTPPVKYLCIEPDPRNLKILAARRFPKVVEVIPAALAQEDGEAELNLSDADYPGGWSLSNSLRRPTGHLRKFPAIKYERMVTVRTRNLESLCKEYKIDRIDLLFMDIEGSEKDVIQSSAGIISRTRYMFVEAWKEELYGGMWTRADLLGVMKARGWVVVEEFEQDVLLENRLLVSKERV